jgi:hypothetical protein
MLVNTPQSLTESHWRNLVLPAGALCEHSLVDSRLILWLPAQRVGRFQSWLRIVTVARATVSRHENLCAVPATALCWRQHLRGLLSHLFHSSTQRGWCTGGATRRDWRRSSAYMLPSSTVTRRASRWK